MTEPEPKRSGCFRASVFLSCSDPLSGLTHRKIYSKERMFNHLRVLSLVKDKRFLSRSSAKRSSMRQQETEACMGVHRPRPTYSPAEPCSQISCMFIVSTSLPASVIKRSVQRSLTDKGLRVFARGATFLSILVELLKQKLVTLLPQSRNRQR